MIMEFKELKKDSKCCTLPGIYYLSPTLKKVVGINLEVIINKENDRDADASVKTLNT